MSARLALGAMGALAGLAAFGARRGSQAEAVWYHCGSRPPGAPFDLERYAGAGEGAVTGSRGPGGVGVYLTDNIGVARIYCRYAEQPFLSAFKLRGRLRYGGTPEGHFPTTAAGRDALLAQGFVGAAHRFEQADLPHGPFTEIVVYDPAALVEVSSVPVSAAGRTRDQLRSVVRQQVRSGRSTVERPSARRRQAGAQLRQLRARGSRAALLQQLPPGFVGQHSEDAEDSGLDLVVELQPALRAAVEVIEDLYGEGWRDIGGKVDPRHLLREAGLRANDRVVVISFIEVPPLQRGMGLGAEGVERIERWARSQGATGILLRSGQTGQPSWAHPTGFWRHMGYRELHLHDDPVDADDQDAILFKSAARFATQGARNQRRFTVKTQKEGLDLIRSKVYTDNWQKALRHKPEHQVAVLVPCAGTKPFSEAPSHKHGYMPALEGLPVDRWVVAEPLGVVPWSWGSTWPNDAYDYPPSLLKGAARKLLVERIRDWFTGPGRRYRQIYLALPGHHGRLVRDAVKDLELPLVDVSITACRGAKRSCSAKSFRATSQEYRRWLRRQVQEGASKGSRAKAPSAPMTPAFLRWFGKSKVVDRGGRPLRVYHGTAESFDVFDVSGPEDDWTNFSAVRALGAAFSSSPIVADSFIHFKRPDGSTRALAGAVPLGKGQHRYPVGASILPVYLRIERPKVYASVGELQEALLPYMTGRRSPDQAGRALRRDLIRAGHDGIFFTEGTMQRPHRARRRAFIVFEPTQVKSATGNAGDYDPERSQISLNRSGPGRPRGWQP